MVKKDEIIKTEVVNEEKVEPKTKKNTIKRKKTVTLDGKKYTVKLDVPVEGVIVSYKNIAAQYRTNELISAADTLTDIYIAGIALQLCSDYPTPVNDQDTMDLGECYFILEATPLGDAIKETITYKLLKKAQENERQMAIANNNRTSKFAQRCNDIIDEVVAILNSYDDIENLDGLVQLMMSRDKEKEMEKSDKYVKLIDDDDNVIQENVPKLKKLFGGGKKKKD